MAKISKLGNLLRANHAAYQNQIRERVADIYKELSKDLLTKTLPEEAHRGKEETLLILPNPRHTQQDFESRLSPHFSMAEGIRLIFSDLRVQFVKEGIESYPPEEYKTPGVPVKGLAMRIRWVFD